MSYQKNYKRFIAQFKAAEWRVLSEHRPFLHFLKFDLKTAASVAADALQRPVTYVFPTVKKAVVKKPSDTSLRLSNLRRHRRFRF